MAFGAVGLSLLQRRRRKVDEDVEQMKKRSMGQIRRNMVVQKRLKDLNMTTWPPAYRKLVITMIKIETSKKFNRLIIGAILLAGILAGVNTYKATETGTAGTVGTVLDSVILYLFALEVVVKILARGTKPWSYFYDHWNKFDFTIVLLSFLPLDFDFTVLRTLRLLRVLRLLNAMTKLRILVQSLFASLKAILYVCMLLLLVFYIYSVMGVFLFKENDPFHFRSLEVSFMTMYRTATFEDWTDIMYINTYGCDRYGYDLTVNATNLDGSPRPWFMNCTAPAAFSIGAVLFFCSFTLFTTMILFNLFIGVILTNIEKSQEEILAEIARELRVIESQLAFVDSTRYSLNNKRKMNESQIRWQCLGQKIFSGKWRTAFGNDIQQLILSEGSGPSNTAAWNKFTNPQDLSISLDQLDSEISALNQVIDELEALGVIKLSPDRLKVPIRKAVTTVSPTPCLGERDSTSIA